MDIMDIMDVMDAMDKDLARLCAFIKTAIQKITG